MCSHLTCRKRGPKPLIDLDENSLGPAAAGSQPANCQALPLRDHDRDSRVQPNDIHGFVAVLKAAVFALDLAMASSWNLFSPQ